MNARNVDIIITNSYRPVWTFRAIEAIKGFYPGNRIIIVDDCCVECDRELTYFTTLEDVEVIRQTERMGAGRAIDAGMRAASGDWVLTHDHGVTIRTGGVIEYLLQRIGPNVGAVGRPLRNKRGEDYLGRGVYCDLAIWNRNVIIEHDLSFKLTTLNFEDGTTLWGCTTARYLCWQLRQLGCELEFVKMDGFLTHEHSRDPAGKKFGSPHEDVEFKRENVND